MSWMKIPGRIKMSQALLIYIRDGLICGALCFVPLIVTALIWPVYEIRIEEDPDE